MTDKMNLIINPDTSGIDRELERIQKQIEHIVLLSENLKSILEDIGQGRSDGIGVGHLVTDAKESEGQISIRINLYTSDIDRELERIQKNIEQMVRFIENPDSEHVATEDVERNEKAK